MLIHPYKRSQSQLIEALNEISQQPIFLTLHKNKRTFLQATCNSCLIKLRLHQAFLYASDKLLFFLYYYIKNNDKLALKKLQEFMDHPLFITKPANLRSQGRVHNLLPLYQAVNKTYFKNKLNLAITWFKKPRYKKRVSLTYGSYLSSQKLIQINDLLDITDTPEYFLNYLIYHEALHDTCAPRYVKGRRYSHTKKFREQEQKHSHFHQAIAWQKSFFQRFQKGEFDYGRA